jgi:hypothetical protein
MDNTKKTIDELKKYNKEKKVLNPDFFEEYEVNDNTIYMASLYQQESFLIHCANQKIKFPQVSLYLNLIAKNISMCNLCVSSGCKVDDNCVELACLLNEQDIFKYCIKFDVKPSEKQIYIIINNEYKYNGNVNGDSWKIDECDGKNYKKFIDKDNFISHFSLCIKYLFYYIEKSRYSGDISSNAIGNLTGWILKKFGYNINGYNTGTNIKKIAEKIKEAKGECISFLYNSNINLPKDIFEMCSKHSIKIDTRILNYNEKIEYIEGLCMKYYSTITEAKNIFREFKVFSKSNTKLSDKCFEKLIKYDNIHIINMILDNHNDKFLFPDDINMNKLLEYSKNFGINDLMIKLTNFGIDEIKYNYETLQQCLEYALMANYIELAKNLIEKHNMKLNENHKQKIINSNSILKYLIDKDMLELKIR